jgi:hypothetical protein
MAPFSIHGEHAQEVATDREGCFRFAPTPLANVRLWVTRAGFELLSVTAGVDPAKGLELDLVLRAAVPLSGVVASNGKPVAGGGLWAFPPPPAGDDLKHFLSHSPRIDEADIGPDGRFSFAATSAGDYLLVVTPKGAAAFTVRVHAPANALALKADPGGRLSGLVKDSEGKPVAGARVYLREVSDAAPTHFSAWTVSGPEGRFEAAGMPDGELDIEASPAPPLGAWTIGGSECRRQRIRVTRGAVAEAVELRLGSGGSISGVVLDASGTPARAAKVFAVSPGGPCDLRAAESGADGRFTLQNVSDDRYRIHATAGNGATFRNSDDVQAVAGETDLKLVLKPLKRN